MRAVIRAERAARIRDMIELSEPVADPMFRGETKGQRLLYVLRRVETSSQVEAALRDLSRRGIAR
jgi:hypothetical protein